MTVIRKLLLSNPLVQLAADAVTKDCGLKGTATIKADDQGCFWLEVEGTKQRSIWAIESLMQEAQSLGIDTSHLSLSQTPKEIRSRLIAAIKKAKKNAKDQEAAKLLPKHPYMKTSPAIRVQPQAHDPDSN